MNKKIYLIIGIILLVIMVTNFNLENADMQEENKAAKIVTSESINFKDHKVDIYKGEYNFGGIDDSYKKKIIENGPNFAGHYYFFTSSCGTMCQKNNYVDLKTGKIKSMQNTSVCVDYMRDSNLLAINSQECIEHFRNEGFPIKTYFPYNVSYYLMEDNGTLKYVFVDECENIDGSLCDPKNVVKRFYNFWLSYNQGLMSPNTDRIYRYSPDVTDSFVKKMDELNSRDIHYDPIACSQDPPSNIEKTEFIEIERLGETAIVNVLEHSHFTPNSIMVYLKLVDGLWKIDDIKHVQDEPKG